MRTNTVVLLLLAAPLAPGAPVSVKNLLVGVGPNLFISTSKTPDTATIAALTDNSQLAKWKVEAQRSDSAPAIAITVTRATWSAHSLTFTLQYDAAPLGGQKPRLFGWTVSFADADNPLNTSLDPPPSAGFFSAAKNKDDANLYLAGSYLAGRATKPIYSIDAKVGWVPEIRESGYSAGVEATVAVNSGSSPPADRTRVDPDSITADFTVQFMRGPMAVTLYPARGEFSRANPESNFVPSASVKWITDPLFQSGRHAVVLYPSLGVEAGWNLNQPSVLFKQAVDLSGYSHIARLVPGAYAAYYVRRTKPKSDDPYVLEISMTYAGRLLATKEPFVTSQYVNGTRTPVVTLDRRMRHHLDGVIQWNVSTFVGLQVKYTYGSLPPLFQFTDHQVTLGVTFKAKLPGHI